MNTGGDSIDMDLYVASPNLMFGKTSTGFGNVKGSSRVSTQLGARQGNNTGGAQKNGDYQAQPNTVRTSN